MSKIQINPCNRSLFDDVFPSPMTKKDFLDLCDHLEDSHGKKCDGTIRHTVKFLQKRELDVESIKCWLQQNGGYCDCEVILNVADKLEDSLDG